MYGLWAGVSFLFINGLTPQLLAVVSGDLVQESSSCDGLIQGLRVLACRVQRSRRNIRIGGHLLTNNNLLD